MLERDEPPPPPRAAARFSETELSSMRLGVARRIDIAFRGYNQTEIARMCLTTDTAIRNYREARRFPSPEIMLQMWRVKNISIHWLMTGEGAMNVEKNEANFSEEENLRIQTLAQKNNVSFDEMVKRLALGAMQMLENFK